MPLLILHLALSWALTGLIWTVQLTHYPTFRHIADANFPAFHQHHTRSITLIVMPLMLGELGLCLWSVWQQPDAITWWIPLLLVALIWASTFFVQVPLHAKLSESRDGDVVEQLIRTNRIRTLAWTLKALYISLLPWLFG